MEINSQYIIRHFRKYFNKSVIKQKELEQFLQTYPFQIHNEKQLQILTEWLIGNNSGNEMIDNEIYNYLSIIVANFKVLIGDLNCEYNIIE